MEDRNPTNVQEALSNYWEGKQVCHPGTGELVNAPLVLLSENMRSDSANNFHRISRARIQEDNLTILLDKTLLLAPEEVIQEAFAFLLACAYINLAGLGTEHILVSRQVRENYRAKQQEITLAFHLVDQWGFDSDLLCYWDVAVEDYGADWPAAYAHFKTQVIG